MACMGRTSVKLASLYTRRSRPQHRALPAKATGRAANQESQEGAFPSMDMRSMANRFWGLLMGLVMPPKLLAMAMPGATHTRSAS